MANERVFINFGISDSIFAFVWHDVVHVFVHHSLTCRLWHVGSIGVVVSCPYILCFNNWIISAANQICDSWFLDPGSQPLDPWIRIQPFQICGSVDPDPVGSSLDPWIRGSLDPGSPIPGSSNLKSDLKVDVKIDIIGDIKGLALDIGPKGNRLALPY